MRVDEFPKPGGKVSATKYVVTSGGQSGNAAVAIARLGGRVKYAGALGDMEDEVATSITANFAREGIDYASAVRVKGASSSVSIVMLDHTGEKMIATRRDSGLSEVAPDNADALVADVDAVLIDNRYENFAKPVCAAALKRGIPRVIDLDRVTRPDDPLLAGCTHIVASAEALRGTAGEADIGAALKVLGKHLQGFLAATDGPDGVYWLDHGKVRHMPAFKVDVVDSLGAGDTFHGAFVFRLVECGDEVDAMRFGSATAAIKCTRFGGLMGAPSRAEVDAFLKERAAPALEAVG